MKLFVFEVFSFQRFSIMNSISVILMMLFSYFVPFSLIDVTQRMGPLELIVDFNGIKLFNILNHHINFYKFELFKCHSFLYKAQTIKSVHF